LFFFVLRWGGAGTGLALHAFEPVSDLFRRMLFNDAIDDL
jgi:hypothetical protein